MVSHHVYTHVQLVEKSEGIAYGLDKTIDHLLLDGSNLRFTSTGILRYVIFNNLTRFHALNT